jgi:hypothetical protein
VFAADMVEWRCACCSCFEGLQQSKSHRNQSGLNNNSNLFSSAVPDLAGYGLLVRNYNARELTHPEDVLAAFAGITTALGQTFYGGFICGLPSLFFDIALCWEPFVSCQRRIPSCSSSATMAGLPSWSWAGWEGIIETEIWEAGCDHIKSSRGVMGTLRIVSTVQWYCRPWGTKESRLIQGPEEIRAWKALVTTDRHNLPAGWTRLEYTPDPDEEEYEQSVHSLDRAASTAPHYYYKHKSAPTTEFWYPIPLCEGLQAPPPRHSETLINCRTQRTWLYVANRVADTYFPTYRSTYSLYDAEGAWVGVLYLHSKPESLLNNSICELVEISRGYAVEGDRFVYIDEWRLPDRPKSPDGETYEFINVLWVEWEEGIAYRKAYGRVMESAWEAQELEWIDLVLG